MKYQRNINITSGTPFSREFFITNIDGSLVNLTGAIVTAYLAKHPGAVFANDTTADHIFYNYIPFSCYVVDGNIGSFSLNLDASQTILLEEGKYVYSVMITDINGNDLGEVISGVAFVDSGLNPEFGSVGPQESS